MPLCGGIPETSNWGSNSPLTPCWLLESHVSCGHLLPIYNAGLSSLQSSSAIHMLLTRDPKEKHDSHVAENPPHDLNDNP